MGLNCANQLTAKLNWTIYIPPKSKINLNSLNYFIDSDKSYQQDKEDIELELDKNLPKSHLIVHLTDLHADLHYEQGSAAECDEPVCCRASSVATQPIFSSANFNLNLEPFDFE